MKKLKQMMSDITKKIGSDKNISFVKPTVATKSRPKMKKTCKENQSRQSKRIEEVKRSSRTPLAVSRSNVQNKNKRSNSLIFEKKPLLKANVTHNASELAQQLAFIKKEEIKQVDSSRLMYSIRGQNNEKQMVSMGSSAVNICYKQEAWTQSKQTAVDYAQVQCQLSQVERQELLIEIEMLKGQKTELKRNVSALQAKISEISKEYSIKQCELKTIHQKQQEQARVRYEKLKQVNLNLTTEKKSLQQKVSSQQKQIQSQQENQLALKQKLREEQASRLRLTRVNEQLNRQVIFYKEEMSGFESSLKDFQKMKRIYESRLDELEREKAKIKEHACELLGMVEKCKREQVSP